MSRNRALDRERRLLAGVCTYSGCTDLAMCDASGAIVSEHCAPHDAHEKGRARAKAARRRLRRRQDKRCRDCGQPSARERCASCREVQRLAASARRRVTGDSCRVPGEFDMSGLVSSIRLGSGRTFFATLELPLALLLGAGSERVAPCGHRVCSRNDGREFCVYQAIKSARRMRQLDGRAPDERGARNGNEYALTVEQIAQMVGVTPRSIEQSLKSALDKLRNEPQAADMLRALFGE